MNFYIARHGQDEDNAAMILNGRRDKLLTDLGRHQAKNLGLEIKKTDMKFDYVYTSPLTRTRQTAEIVCKEADLPTPVIHEGLIERDFGIMSGKKISDIKRICAPDIIISDAVTYFLNPEGAETFPELLSRASHTLDDIKSKHTKGNILLVTHGDLGKMTYASYYKLPWKDVLTQFHFGNSELLLLSPNTTSDMTHVFKFDQFNG